MTTSAFPAHLHPVPSKDRTGLLQHARHLLDTITTAGLGADVHHHVEPSNEPCTWCPDSADHGPHSVSVLVHHDGGRDAVEPTLECCYYCVRTVVEHLQGHGVHPESVTLDVSLSSSAVAS